ncbi:hypothetical protein FACS1894198_1990 [Clostridia bacterium]|nr:hypothetical protein FACS1894198_1990 [Clostridia bacterium]
MGGFDRTKGLDVNDLQILNNLSGRVEGVAPGGVQNNIGAKRAKGDSFAVALKQQVKLSKHAEEPSEHGITWTKHAILRLAERGITVTAQDEEKISTLCDKGKEKYKGDDQIGLSLCGNVFVAFPENKVIRTVLDANGKDGVWVDNIKGFYFG